MSILYLFFLVFTVFPSEQTDYGFGNLEIVSDLSPEYCFGKEMGYLQESDYGLPTCVNEFNSEKKCDQYRDPNGEYKNMIYPPTSCAKDGTFNPVQCKGERATGRCFCFDKDGNRLFGQQWWSQADNMTCACSRRKSDMADSIYFNSLHCNSMGNYENLQCDIISEQCWCADEQTGALTSPVVPSVSMSKLPCYRSQSVGTRYLRQCENKKYAQKSVEHQLDLRGTWSSLVDILCDDDGSFGAYSVTDGLSNCSQNNSFKRIISPANNNCQFRAYCTWRDNTKIGSWQSGDDRNSITCNCARDTKIFSEAGKTQAMICNANGNYKAFQSSGGTNYCIDSDGYRKSPTNVVINEEEDCLEYYSFNE